MISMSDNISLFAKNLKKERERLNITQKALAEQVNATPTTISAYEKGTKNPSLDMAANLAKTLGISLDCLCGLNNRPQMNNYGDLLNFIVAICDKGKVDVEPDDYHNVCLLRCRDDKINAFLKSWSKVMSKLADNSGTESELEINKALYTAWLEKQIQAHAEQSF